MPITAFWTEDVQTSSLDPPTTTDQQARFRIAKHAMWKTTQVMALTSPVLYAGRLAFAARRGTGYRASWNGFLRWMAVGTMIAGPAGGFFIGTVRMENTIKERWQLLERQRKLDANVLQTQVDDYSTVGAVVGALVTSAVLLKRVRLYWLIPGGASLGVAGGVLTHLFQSKSQGESVKPTGMVDPLRVTE